MGGCRKAADERNLVVDADLHCCAVPNLFNVDDNVCPTQGSGNPAPTIMAIAERAAAYLMSAPSAA